MNVPSADTRSFFLPALAFGAVGFVLHLAPDGRALVGWDEWILAEIIGRLARISAVNGELYDVLIPTSYAYPPVFFWLSSMAVALGRAEVWAYRFGTALGAGMCALFSTLIGFRVGGRWCGSVAGVIASTSLSLSYYDTVSMDPLMTGVILWGVYCFVRYLKNELPSYMVMALLLTGLACAVKYHAVVFHGVMCGAAAVYFVRSGSLRGRVDRLVLAALLGPVAVLALEGISAHFYGWEKTHIAEAMRMAEWPVIVRDPMSGYLVEPRWTFYPVLLFLKFGIVQTALGFVGAVLIVWRGDPLGRWVLGFALLWFLWAQLLDMKHGRYLLPMVCLAFVMVGYAVSWLAAGEVGRHWALVVTVMMVVGVCWQAKARMDGYSDRVDRLLAVVEAVKDHVPEDEAVLSDSRPYQGTLTTGLHHIDGPIVTPFAAGWRDSNFLLTHESGFQSIEAGTMAGLQQYVPWRSKALATWEVLFDVGTGLERVRLFKRPGVE